MSRAKVEVATDGEHFEDFTGWVPSPEAEATFRFLLRGKPSGSKVRIVAEDPFWERVRDHLDEDAPIGPHAGCDDPALDIEGPGGRTLRDG